MRAHQNAAYQKPNDRRHPNPEVDEFVAIYYIGDTTVANRETLMFDIDVTPDGVETPSRVRFQREFYTD